MGWAGLLPHSPARRSFSTALNRITQPSNFANLTYSRNHDAMGASDVLSRKSGVIVGDDVLKVSPSMLASSAASDRLLL